MGVRRWRVFGCGFAETINHVPPTCGRFLDAVVFAEGPLDEAGWGEAGEDGGEAGLEKIADADDGRRVGLGDEAQDGLGDEARGRSDGHVVVYGPPGGVDAGLVGGVAGLIESAGGGVEVGEDVAGLEVNDADAGVGEFDAEAVADW